MPLLTGSSQKVVSQNIRELHGGKTYSHTAEKFGADHANRQAIAIALSQARKRADGGVVNWPFGGGGMGDNGLGNLPPQFWSALQTAMQQQTGMPQTPQPPQPPTTPAMPNWNVPNGQPAAAATAPTPQNQPPTLPAQASQTAVNAVQGILPNMGGQPQPGQAGFNPAQMPALPPQANNGASAIGTLPSAFPSNANPMNGIANNIPGRAFGGMNMAKGPNLNPPWFARSEAHSLTRGPILSAVPGRTDAHATHVPSGSYVLPADLISGRGQGNTLAGMQNLQKLFRMGPYGTPGGQIHAGHTRPPVFRAPKQAGMMARGGREDSNIGKPVPVHLAGGELVIPPENIMAVVHRDLKIAHAMLDRWVIKERKKLRKTLANLPGPAKD